jgi:hypothetical protein
MQKHFRPLWIIYKAVALFAAANLLFALWPPPVENLTLYNFIFSGRSRFAHGSAVTMREQSIHEFDAAFRAHEISMEKSPNELRVVLLGDSAVWGNLLETEKTLTGVLNKKRITCGDKIIRFYNLGYPGPSALKDITILARTKQYHPDAFLWLVTLRTFDAEQDHELISTNPQYASQIGQAYQIAYPMAKQNQQNSF